MNKNIAISSTAIFIYLLGTGIFYLSLLKVLGSYGIGIFISLLSYGNFFGQLTTLGIDNQYLLTTLDSKTNNIIIFISYFKKIINPILINILISIICGIFIFKLNNLSSLFLVSVLVIYLPLSQLIQSQFIASNNTFYKIIWFSSQPWIKSLGIIIILLFYRNNLNNINELIINAKFQTGFCMGIVIIIMSLFVVKNLKNISKKIKIKSVSKRFEKKNQNLYFGIDHMNFHAVLSLTVPVSSLFLDNISTSSLALAYSIYTFPHLLFFIIWQQLFLKRISKLSLNQKYKSVILIVNKIKKKVIFPLIFIYVISFSLLITILTKLFNIESPNFTNELIVLSLSLIPNIYLISQNTLINSAGKIKVKSTYGTILIFIYFIVLSYAASKYSSIGVAMVHTLFIYTRSYIYDNIISKNYKFKKI